MPRTKSRKRVALAGQNEVAFANDGLLLNRCWYESHRQYKRAGHPLCQWWICASCHPAQGEVVKFLEELDGGE